MRMSHLVIGKQDGSAVTRSAGSVSFCATVVVMRRRRARKVTLRASKVRYLGGGCGLPGTAAGVEKLLEIKQVA